MKNKIDKIIKNNKIVFFLILFIGLFITIPSIIPSFNVDAYCTIASNYTSSVKTFLKSGRIITAFFYYLASILKLPFSIFSIFSIISANVFLSLSVYKIFNHLKKYVKNDILKQYLLLIGSFLLFYNPLVIELLLFEEAFIMCLGIYLVVLSTLTFIKEKSLLLSFILTTLACICYQGILCFYIPILFLLVILEYIGDIKKEYKDIIKKGITVILFYGFSLIISFLIVKFINHFIYTDGTAKLGTINIIYNIKKMIELMFFSLKGLFGFVNRPIFYLCFILLFILTLLKNKKEEHYYSKVFYFLINIFLCIIMPFIPNLGMNSNMNYTAARMITSIGSIIGIVIIYSVLYFDITYKKNIKKIFIGLILFYSVYNSYNYFYTSYVGLKRYEKDMNAILNIHEMINWYEKEYDQKVKTIKYMYNKKAESFYLEYHKKNSYNYRVYSIDWAMGCAVNMNKEKYTFIKMNEEEIKKYSDELIKEEQIIFEEETLYLLLY